MKKERFEAFNDAILAIIMTILVLNLSIPAEPTWQALFEMRSEFAAYAISFFVVAVCWMNHHQMMQLVEKVNGKILWVNTILLFWISLIPFVTDWVGKNSNSFVPCFCYGLDFLLMNVTYAILQNLLLKAHGEDTGLFYVFGKSIRTNIAIILCAVSLLLAFAAPWLVLAVTLIVFSLWIIPNKDFKKYTEEKDK